MLLNITGSKQILAEIVNEMPFLVWIHSITAGVDHILCPEIVDNNDILLTNAKGAVSLLVRPRLNHLHHTKVHVLVVCNNCNCNCRGLQLLPGGVRDDSMFIFRERHSSTAASTEGACMGEVLCTGAERRHHGHSWVSYVRRIHTQLLSPNASSGDK